MDVFFLFPGRFDYFYLSLGSQQTKNPTGQKCFVCFGTFRGDTEFWFRVSIRFAHRSIGPSSVRRCPTALAAQCLPFRLLLLLSVALSFSSAVSISSVRPMERSP